jgi:outer membrane protein
MKWKKGTLALIAGAFAATLLMSGCGQTRIGYVDSERLMKESPQIQSLVDEGNQKMEEEGKKIDADLSEKKGQLSDEDFAKEEAKARQRMAGLQQSYMVQIQQKVNAALDPIAKEKKLDAIVTNQTQEKVAVEGGIDVTDEAIQKLQ